MMMMSTTKTEEREQWRARILRALAELRTEPVTNERGGVRDDETDGATASSKF